MSGFNTITSRLAQPTAQPAQVVPSPLQGAASGIQAGADVLSKFAQASIQRDKRMLLTQTQTDLIAGVDEARTQALDSANPTEADEMFGKSMELLAGRVNEIEDKDVRFEANQYLERRAITARSSLINESSRNATSEDLVVLDTFLKSAVLEGDEDEAARQIFGRVGTTLTQGEAESMFRGVQVDTQLEFMNQVLRTEPQNLDAFMDAGAFDKLNEGTLLAATGMAARAQDQQEKIGAANAFSNAKADIDEVLSEGFKPDALASHVELQTEVIFAEPGNVSSRGEIRNALLEPGLKAAAAELQPNQFDAIAALMPSTPENRTLIADERRVMEGRIASEQVIADGADVIGAVLDHGATGLALPTDDASWGKYVDRRFVAGDSVPDVALDVIGAGQPLPPSIINGMEVMSNEASLDAEGLLTIYGAMDSRDAIAVASTMPQPELNSLLRDTAQNYEPGDDVYGRRVAALENPRVREELPNSAILFDGGKIGDEEYDAKNVTDQLSNTFGDEVSGTFFDPNITITPLQRESIRSSFIVDMATRVGMHGDKRSKSVSNSALVSASKSFIESNAFFRTGVFAADDVVFTDQIEKGSVGYQKSLTDWQANGAKQPGMIFDWEGMKATPSVANGTADSFMVFDPSGKKEASVLRPGDNGFVEARRLFYGEVPSQQRVERPGLSYQASYGDVHPSQVSTELNNGLMLEAVKKWTGLSGRNYTTGDQQEVLDVYNQLKVQYGWPSVPPPE